MKRPVIILVGVLSLAALIVGVALLPGVVRPQVGQGPYRPMHHGPAAHHLPPEELPLPVLEGLERLSEEERAGAVDFLRRLPPRQHRRALIELRDCPAGEFRGRLEGMMGNPPYPPFPWPLVLLFLGSLGIAVTLFLAIRRRGTGARLERCPHCGRPVEKGWNYCPYCTNSLELDKDLTQTDRS